ncbi:MAG TPA: NAD(P)H-dependent glycerol-3-phosphate dehydrogenase [Bacteroidales bacterium]|jgi:glycerol-3-phosphate dehydrogenase (NAD(P)+)|nr:NAD(P)H-dependent glycerol-3-phosphate dehydrogenase [Bacteroidales bacterium]HNV94956.1 NAD(P)H-dependent glycerol-3-phosphate dehydrogenase [Bacteroidales bacterium]HOU98480.1 NAD(P)H-dependent glycerol-3-phosphate dehydrogenase [Bacteroidales bacterium]
MNKIGIIGEGSWGTALLKILQQNGHFVNWLVRDQEIRSYITKNYHNPNYSSDVEIDMERCALFDSVNDLISACELVFLVLPSAYTEEVLKELSIEEVQKVHFFSATKGILPETNLTVTQYLQSILQVSEQKIGFISGPSHAEEIARERLTYLTVMSKNNALAQEVAALLSNRYILAKVNSDVLGAEYATALKNVMAIAVGIAHGLGYGDNFIAVLVSNALKEIERFVNTLHPHQRNITDYVYLGDLLVTCYSQYSRNRTLGLMLGKGYSIKAAQLEMNMVAEGYYAVKSIVKIANENKIEMPISQTVYHILYERYSPTIEMRLLTDKLQ